MNPSTLPAPPLAEVYDVAVIGGDGQPGYFQQELFVYGRGGEACKVCGSELRNVVLGQRASVFCPKCQR